MFVLVSFSALWDAAGQHGGLPGLVLCGLVPWSGPGSFHPLDAALHSVCVCVLVPTSLWSLQVRAQSPHQQNTDPPCCSCLLTCTSRTLIYGAAHVFCLCRSDSSFRFFVFFFVYICQFGVYVMQCIGITSWGAR